MYKSKERLISLGLYLKSYFWEIISSPSNYGFLIISQWRDKRFSSNNFYSLTQTSQGYDKIFSKTYPLVLSKNDEKGNLKNKEENKYLKTIAKNKAVVDINYSVYQRLCSD